MIEKEKKIKKIKKKVFVITSIYEDGEERIDTIEHKLGEDFIRHNNEIQNGEFPKPAPPNIGEKTWLLTNPQYWWKDSDDVWHCYCWGGSTC